MTTYVLVHGAWGGAHTWRTVRPLLWAGGHHVFTPALTGIGERAHLVNPQIGLRTHIDDVVNLILYEDLSEIVLVGFSYGGLVIAGALEHIADRVSHLVFLDALVPVDGQSACDITGWPVEVAPGPESDWLLQPRPRDFADPVEAAFAEPRRTAQPARTFTDPVHLGRPLEAFACGRTFIKATGDARNPSGPDAFWDAADRYRDHPAWSYDEIDSNHMVPQNQPAILAEILLALAS